MSLIDRIPHKLSVKDLTDSELLQLCTEIREYLIDVILQSGGHFSGNLGVVELTVALHHVLDLPNDRLIWDVGHQSYPHKILTSRKEAIRNIRKKGGISGFPKMTESEYDSFGTGHSSTSISACLGFAIADQRLGEQNENVAVMGDGSLTGGMAWEALNHAGSSNMPITIIINDNDIGIDPNQGALAQYLNGLMAEAHSGNVFEDWQFTYFSVKDGHNMLALIQTLRKALKCDGPRIIHIKTIKGKGFDKAEKERTKWHAVKYVKIASGNGDHGARKGEKFQDIFGKKIIELAKKDDRVMAITPAMPSGSSLNYMMDEMPDRVFDVGIAEQHAVTLAAGMAAGGLKPFCNIYSSFFQRAYDQFVHDVCLQNLNVTFFLDRAGIVGADGPTHHGLFDIPALRTIPNAVIAAPLDGNELEAMMEHALTYDQGPLVIRYPRGRTSQLVDNQITDISIGKGRKLFEGEKVAILSFGSIGDQAILAREELLKEGIEIGVYDMRFAKPLDKDLIHHTAQQYNHLITLENGSLAGGFGSAVLECLNNMRIEANVTTLGFPDKIIEHAKPRELFAEYGLDAENLVALVKRLIV